MKMIGYKAYNDGYRATEGFTESEFIARIKEIASQYPNDELHVITAVSEDGTRYYSDKVNSDNGVHFGSYKDFNMNDIKEYFSMYDNAVMEAYVD